MAYIRIPSDPGSGGGSGSGSGGGGGGSNGPSFYAGSAGDSNPDPSVGVDGDYYLDTDSGSIWQKAGGEYGSFVFPIPTLGGPLYRFQLTGQASWVQASTVIGNIPSNFNGNAPSLGLALSAVIAYGAQGTQPSNFSLGFNSSSNVLNSRTMSGLSNSTFATFIPSGATPLGQPGQQIIIAPVGGIVSGGGACRFDLIGVLR